MPQEAKLQPADVLARLRARRAALLRAGGSYSASAARVALAREIRGLDLQIAVYEGALERLGKLEKLAAQVGLPYQPPSRDRNWLDLLAGLRHRLDRRDGCIEIARVAHVIDGDGVRLADGREVRYIGIDAPEMVNVFGDPEPWAQEATDANARLVAGKDVRLEREVSDADRHSRLLRHVYVGDTWINGKLVHLGMATILPIRPDVRYQAQLERLQAEAQHARRGLWSEA